MSYMISPPYYAIPSQSPKWTPSRVMGVGTGAPGFGPQMGPDYLKRTIEREIQQCGDAQPRWDAVWKDALAAEPLVAPARLPFYRAEVLTMIAINRDSNRILFLVSNAIQDAQTEKGKGASRSRRSSQRVRRDPPI